MDDHDAAGLAVVKRFLDGEGAAIEGQGNQPAWHRLEGDTKVFELTIDPIKHRIDAEKDPIDALGFNSTWPGPRLDVIEGDKVRAVFTNNLDESTGIHFHGQKLPNNMDGAARDPGPDPAGRLVHLRVHRLHDRLAHVPLAPQRDRPGRPRTAGRVHRPPRDEADRVEQKYGVSQDIVWISNDSLGGFTINGRGFPATAPIVANLVTGS